MKTFGQRGSFPFGAIVGHQPRWTRLLVPWGMKLMVVPFFGFLSA
jgi:hypothetical protein